MIKKTATAAQFKEWLLDICLNHPTKYDNIVTTITGKKIFKNCGYCYQEKNGTKYYSWDCWNLTKTHGWGWTPGYSVGSFLFAPGKNEIGDWNGRELMDHCDGVSTDMRNIVQGELLLTAAEDHVGHYIGGYIWEGYYFNVVECSPQTTNTVGGVHLSYMDEQGRRYNHRGGVQMGAWKTHGRLPWIDYGAGTPLSYTIKADGSAAVIEFDGRGVLTAEVKERS